jgi:hypothetical protein
MPSLMAVRNASPAVETMLWYYAHGKPKEMVEHHGERDLSRMSDAELEKYTRERYEAAGACPA